MTTMHRSFLILFLAAMLAVMQGLPALGWQDAVDIEILTNRPGDVCRPGEELTFSVKSSRKGYLTVVVWTSGEKMLLVYPTKGMKKNLVSPGEVIRYPAEGAVRVGKSIGTDMITAILSEKPTVFVTPDNLEDKGRMTFIKDPTKFNEAVEKAARRDPKRIVNTILPVHSGPADLPQPFAVHTEKEWTFKAWVASSEVEEGRPKPVYLWSSLPGLVHMVELIGDTGGAKSQAMTRGIAKIMEKGRPGIVSLYSTNYEEALAGETSGRIRVEASTDSGLRTTVEIPVVMAGKTSVAQNPETPPPSSPTDGSTVGKTPLLTQAVQPSSADQVVTLSGKVTVTIPGGFLSSPETVTISSVTPGSIPDEKTGDFGSLGVYDVAIGGLKQLPKPIEIAVAYDPARLRKEYAPADQIMAARWDEEELRWKYLPVRVDERTNSAIITTDHLCVFNVLLLLTITLGTADIAHAAYEKAVFDVFHTPNFGVLYEKAVIENDNILHDKAWKGTGGGANPNMRYLETRGGETKSGYRPGVPLFVQDVAGYLEDALEVYRDKRKFQFSYGRNLVLPLSFLPVKINSSLITGKSAKGCFESLYDRVHVNTQYTGNVKSLKTVTAHELFHSIQHFHFNYLKMTQFADYLWWLEACAEYASCRVAWDEDSMGSKGDAGKEPFLNPKLLEGPLPATGQIDQHFDEIEYDKSYFVDYLVRKGLDFRDLHIAVADGGSRGNPILSPLESFLLAGGNSLSELYADFAALFLLSSDSPLGGSEPFSESLDASYRLPLSTPQKKERVEHAFQFPGAYCARLISVKADVAGTGDDEARRLVLKAEGLSGGAYFQGFVLRNNRKPSGEPKPRAVLTVASPDDVVEVTRNDTLYILALNTSVSGAAAGKIIVGDSTVDLSINPASIVDATGKRTWAFEGIAKGIPANVKNVAYEWSFGDTSDSVRETWDRPVTEKISFKRSHTFTDEGTFDVTLELFDKTKGYDVSLAKTAAAVELNSAPSIVFDPPILVTEADSEIEIDARVHKAPKNPRFEWNFGDGTPPVITEAPGIRHAFAAVGEYRMRVEMTDAGDPERVLASDTGRADVQEKADGGVPQGIRHMKSLMLEEALLWLEYDYYTETVKDGKTACVIHGPFRYYSEKDKTEIVAQYVRGYLEGPYRDVHGNGTVHCVGEFSQGEKTGEWIYSYPDGKTQHVFHYREGKLDGQIIHSDEEGRKTFEATAKKGLYSGPAKTYGERDGKSYLSRIVDYGESSYTEIDYDYNGKEQRRRTRQGTVGVSGEQVALIEFACAMEIGIRVPPECSTPVKYYFNKIEEKNKKSYQGGFY